METQFRRVELFIDDEWVPVNFFELEKGDVFRMFDDCELAVEIGQEYVVLSRPCQVHDMWTIECEPANKINT